jgi:DNA repair protein RecO (recombination protein O)
MAGPTRDRGVVLRNISLGDTSRIVSVLSADHGRVKLVAKGSRRIGSRLGPLLEPGNELDLVFYPYRDRELWMLKEAGLRRAALTGGGSLSKLSHLFAALELTDRLLPERETVEEFDALVNGFLEAWHASDDARMPSLFFAFEVQWLASAGLGLDPHECADCGVDLRGFDRVQFRVAEGAIVCPRCATGGGRWIEATALEALRAVVEADFDRPGALPELDAGQKRDVGRLLHEHMTFHLSHYRLPASLYWMAPERAATSERP